MAHRFLEKRSFEPRKRLLRLLFMVMIMEGIEFLDERVSGTCKDSKDQVSQTRDMSFGIDVCVRNLKGCPLIYRDSLVITIINAFPRFSVTTHDS